MERFSLSLAANSAEISAATPLAKRYAQSQLEMGIASGRFGEIVGENCPLFEVRPIWIEKPDFSDLDSTIDTIITAGFNTLILSQAPSAEIIAAIRQSGLKVALTDGPKMADYLFCQEGSCHLTSSCHHTSSSHHTSRLKSPTPFESACEELEALQRTGPVIYHLLPTSDYALALSQMAKKHTHICFQAKRGDLLHPVFADLAKLSCQSTTRLLPTITLEQIELTSSELLTDFPLAHIENVLGRQRPGRFCGAGCLVEQLSPRQHLSQCPLWIAGQRMWKSLNVQALLEMWLPQECLEIFDPNAIHRLFSTKQDIEAASHELYSFAKDLELKKERLKFKKKSKPLLELFHLLSQFQAAFKTTLENACRHKAQKIPLLLQTIK